MNILNIIISACLTSIVTSVVSSVIMIWRHYEHMRSDQKRINQDVYAGIRALLKNEIYTTYSMYKDSDTLPVDIRENLVSLHNAYHSVGGNSTGDKMYEILMTKRPDTDN